MSGVKMTPLIRIRVNWRSIGFVAMATGNGGFFLKTWIEYSQDCGTLHKYESLFCKL